MAAFDFLVIGGGIVGISIARELKRRFSDANVTLIEKEKASGLHASGRNSGVLHAGFYYSADSLKARFTRIGNEAMTAYCASRNIPLNKCGKLVVAKDETELPQLDELLTRGARNKVPLESVTEEQAREIEPRVKTCQRAIFSPTTSSGDPHRVIRAMKQDAKREGVTIVHGTRYHSANARHHHHLGCALCRGPRHQRCRSLRGQNRPRFWVLPKLPDPRTSNSSAETRAPSASWVRSFAQPTQSAPVHFK